MAISFGSGMLAAALLLGQGQEVPGQPQPNTGRPPIFGGFGQSSTTQQQQSRPLFPWFSREDRPVMTKLQSWFGGGPRKDQQEPPIGRQPIQQPTIQTQPGTRVIIEGTPTSNPSTGPIVLPANPTPLDFPKKLPSSSQNGLPKELPAVSSTVAAKPLQQTTLQLPTSNVKTPILPGLANKIGRDDKFEWVTGQLEIESGAYVLYYATPETIDTYKGRIVVQPQQIDMTSFRRGDLISVRGELMQRQTAQGKMPVYRATEAQLIERAK